MYSSPYTVDYTLAQIKTSRWLYEDGDLCEAPQSISVYPKEHTEFQSKSQCPTGLFSSASFATQHRSALLFPCVSNKAAGSSHQKFNGQTSYGRKPGSAEVWYPHIAASEDHLRGPSSSEELFTWNMVPVSSSPGSLPRKVRTICYTCLLPELNYWPFLKQYTVVLLHQLGNSGTKEITSPLWRKEMFFWEGIGSVFKGQTWGCEGTFVFLLPPAWKKDFHVSPETRLDK